jgi:hypothetical protein
MHDDSASPKYFGLQTKKAIIRSQVNQMYNNPDPNIKPEKCCSKLNTYFKILSSTLQDGMSRVGIPMKSLDIFFQFT